VDPFIHLGIIDTLLSFPWASAIALKTPFFGSLSHIRPYQCGNDPIFKGAYNPIFVGC
jgi:hypothetical protein